MFSLRVVILGAVLAATSITTLPHRASTLLANNELIFIAIGGENFDKKTTFPSAQRSPRPVEPKNSHQELASVERYLLSGNQHLTNGANFSGPYAGFGSVLFNASTIYTVGGYGGSGNQTHIYSKFSAYDVVNNQWHYDLPPLPQQVQKNQLLLINSTLYALGGGDYLNNAVIAVYSIDVPANSKSVWRTLATQAPDVSDLPITCAVVMKNSIFVLAGGQLFESSDRAQSWQKKGKMPDPVVIASVCAPMGDDGFVSVGDLSGYTAKHASVYNVTTEKWQALLIMNTARVAPGVVSLPSVGGGVDSRKVLVCGGFGDTFPDDATNTCEIYDLSSNKWFTAEFTLKENRAAFGFHLLSSTATTALQ